MMHYTRTILGVAVLLVAACGDSGASTLDQDTAPDELETEALRVEGVYSVPVADRSLEPFASQPVLVDWRDRDGQYRLDYDFPTDLTGVTQRVAFDGVRASDGTIRLSGDLGTASCEVSLSGDGFVCTERFPQMAFDLQRLERDLERRGLPAEEIARRLEVAMLFRSDPIGILSFSLD